MDIDLLLAPQRWVGKRCTVAQALDDIADAATRAKVTAACDDPRVLAANLHKVFVELVGDSPGMATIRRHQGRKELANPCRCP